MLSLLGILTEAVLDPSAPGVNSIRKVVDSLDKIVDDGGRRSEKSSACVPEIWTVGVPVSSRFAVPVFWMVNSLILESMPSGMFPKSVPSSASGVT